MRDLPFPSRVKYPSVIIFIFILKFSLLHAQDHKSHFPFITPVAVIKGRDVLLKPVITKDPFKQSLTFTWEASINNPAKVIIQQDERGNAVVHMPAMKGEYYFTLIVAAGNNTEKLQTFVIHDGNGLTAFDIGSMKASWLNKAIIYQLTPGLFVKNAKYPDMEAKLPDLADLGINTLYLQPVFKSQRGGQGYDITDYFSLREDLGTEAQLQSLISAAKLLNMRVLFDMVPNHTSIHHPYAKDKIANGINSRYYNFYQRSNDGVEYSSHYHQLPDSFMCYFWNDLVNLDYNNEEVQAWIIDACKYWVKKFDIDGYRFDAMWAVNARCPLFGKRLQLELKSIRPDLLLIAEDKASSGKVYQQGFDAAYDWTKDTNWVSQWSWQYQFDKLNNHTLFNHPSPATRKQLLRKAIFSNADSIGLILRFLENNDQHRFISNHSLEVTKMAASLLFALPGLPMLYNGQEIGFKEFPYKSGPIFKRDSSIRSLNPALFDFYKRLTAIRRENDALVSPTLQEIPLKNDSGAVAFLRNSKRQDIVVIINMAGDPDTVKFNLNTFAAGRNKATFTDLVSGEMITGSKKAGPLVTIPVMAYTTRILLLNKVRAVRKTKS